ncbi:response regulator transcription factor [Kutzneria viridogrisea]|uniref:Two-component system response regulator n=2 Tax=Kutzneria TaxID=43356 RepID=W5W8E0_9PSEU|nr:response regulator transcription factor [Kutzneria albida]AHH97020.1 two-component system response regulator [Kutzneria albida DSM 43870]MBA8932013.1 DNA-binding NarL/FixJ family response regulator [Kutzneria viridogrisea]
MSVKLVVVDDQASVREALAVMLGLAEDIEVVATATNGEQAVAAVAEHGPDVVLMDLHMPVLTGVEATERIRGIAPRVQVLVLTTFEDDESILAALQAGASGYLTKEADRATILQAVRSASHGQAVLDPQVQRRLLHLATRRPAPAAGQEQQFGLTAREQEVLGLIGEGLRNPEIAARLVISEATVKTHINNLFAKGGFHSRADAVRYVLSTRR